MKKTFTFNDNAGYESSRITLSDDDGKFLFTLQVKAPFEKLKIRLKYFFGPDYDEFFSFSEFGPTDNESYCGEVSNPISERAFNDIIAGAAKYVVNP